METTQMAQKVAQMITTHPIKLKVAQLRGKLANLATLRLNTKWKYRDTKSMYEGSGKNKAKKKQKTQGCPAK